jgi:hypothetical protein
MTPGDLYRTCRVSQHYDVPSDAERQDAFHAGRPLPPPRREKLDDLRLIANLRKSGREVGRVHIVAMPLSAYVRYELAVYEENVAAGENILIADRSGHEQLAHMSRDFAVFDGGTPEASVILFEYDDVGRLGAYEHVTDPTAVHAHWAEYQRAAALATPWATFIANCS